MLPVAAVPSGSAMPVDASASQGLQLQPEEVPHPVIKEEHLKCLGNDLKSQA